MTHTKEDIKKLANKVFGDATKAEAWLITPVKVLNDHTPTSRLQNAEGIEEVRALLLKIESGEFT